MLSIEGKVIISEGKLFAVGGLFYHCTYRLFFSPPILSPKMKFLFQIIIGQLSARVDIYSKIIPYVLEKLPFVCDILSN